MCQLHPSVKPCHPGDGNGRIFARSQLTSPSVGLPAGPIGCAPAGPSDGQQVTTQAVMYIGSLFVPGRVAGKTLSFLVETGYTHNLLSRTVFDRLPAQNCQQMVYGETVAAMATAAVCTYMEALVCRVACGTYHLRRGSLSVASRTMPSSEWSSLVNMTVRWPVTKGVVGDGGQDYPVNRSDGSPPSQQGPDHSDTDTTIR